MTPKRYTVTARRTRTRVIKSPVTLDLYGLPFVSRFLLHDIRAVFCHVYVRFVPKYMTIFLQTRIYMRTKKSHTYALQTSMWYMGLQKVVV